MALSHVEQVQEKQFRAVLRCCVPEGRSVIWELPKDNSSLFLLGTHGRQMAWRKDTAIMILATGGWQGWVLVLIIRTLLSPVVFWSEILVV